MKRIWAPEELIDQWTFLPAERTLIEEANTESNRLGFALLLKWFQYEGRFPHAPLEVPAPVVTFLAEQLDVSPDVWRTYPWQSRTMERQRAAIRQHCGVREATVQDSDDLVVRLLDQVLPHQRQREAITAALYERCRAIRLEPPAPKRIERLIGSALHTADERVYSATLARLSPETCAKLDALLTVSPTSDDEAAPGITRSGDSAWQVLKSDPGPVGLESFLTELAKLQQLRVLGLPPISSLRSPPKSWRVIGSAWRWKSCMKCVAIPLRSATRCSPPTAGCAARRSPIRWSTC